MKKTLIFVTTALLSESYNNCRKVNKKMNGRNKKKRGTFGILLDFLLVICTGGLWLIWILIRYLRNNS